MIWKVVNEITGRKKAKEGQVSGNSPEERVNTWFTHFKNLLGNQPDVDDPDEAIPTVFDDVDINDEPFTMEEYKKVKLSLKLCKVAGPDSIPLRYSSCVISTKFVWTSAMMLLSTTINLRHGHS